MSLHFGEYVLEPEEYLLVGPEGPVAVEPQVFEVLAHLIRHRDRVVTKEELLDEVWGDRFVSPSALTSRIKTARATLGDSGREQRIIRTVHGRGYQFVADVVADDPVVPRADSPVSEVPAGSRLPPITDELRGRVDELAELEGLAARQRLITLLGPGGTGKTRLAIELARRRPTDDRVVFVDLTAVRDEHALGQVLALALGIQSGQHDDVIDACCGYLRTRPHFLVVDNCEHVIEAAADLVRRLLDATTSSSIVATSRLPLGLRSERLYRLQPLPVPARTDGLTLADAAANPAVGLFIDRARAADREFRFDESSCAEVVDLCAALDGLPLALELAAGRVAVFSVGDLLGRLDRRLDLLGDDRGAPGDVGNRHRTLRATVDWSYDLLDDDGRRLLRTLSAFPAGSTLDCAEWVATRLGLSGDPLAVMSRLVEASLVGRTETRSGTRYVQLETIRAFGLDRLEHAGELDTAGDLLADWVLHLTRELVVAERTAAESVWNDRIRREMPNLREARQHLLAADRPTELIDLSAGLTEWSRLRDVSEIWTWVDELMDLAPSLEPGQRARCEALAAQSASRRGRIDETIGFARRALTTGDDPWIHAQATSALGIAALFQGDFEAAAAQLKERAALDGYAVDLANAALCRAYAGDIAAAREEAAAVRRDALEDQWPTAIAWTSYVIGEIEATAGSGEQIPWLESAIELADEIGAAFIIGVAGLTLCNATLQQGNVGEAADRYRDLIEHWLRSGSWTQQWTTMRHAAALLADADPELALLVLTTAAADPYSPRLGAAAAEAEDRRRAELITTLGTRRATEITAAPIDRAELAERTRRSLEHLATSG